MSRSLLLALAVAAVVAAVVASATSAVPAAAAPAVGVADNKADMFGDARFGALGVRHVRASVPWDVLSDSARRAQLDAWMAGARRHRARVLLTFDRSPRRPRANPSPRQLAAALRGLRRRYPGQVRDVATWNEPNINKRPELVARWWLALRAACPTCRVLAGDLVDRRNAASYARRVARAARREPRLWGLHNYLDVNRFTTKGTVAVLRATAGEVWLTETGGVERRRNASGVPFAGSGSAHAARATRFLFARVAALSPRITRVYLYHWNTPPGRLSWDSGLVGPEGERPALGVLRAALRGRIRTRRPRTRIPSVARPVVPGGRGRRTALR